MAAKRPPAKLKVNRGAAEARRAGARQNLQNYAELTETEISDSVQFCQFCLKIRSIKPNQLHDKRCWTRTRAENNFCQIFTEP
jgi:hypothetical protein